MKKAFLIILIVALSVQLVLSESARKKKKLEKKGKTLRNPAKGQLDLFLYI